MSDPKASGHLAGHIGSVSDIQIAQDLAFQERNWALQRIGWGIMLLIILAALAGLFGRGPAAEATAGRKGDPLQLRYERLTRHASPTHLELTIAPGAAPEGKARLWLGRDYLRHTRIEQVVPEPESVETQAGGVIYEFKVANPAEPARIKFDIEPEGYWSRAGEVGLEGRPRLRFNQFVFP